MTDLCSTLADLLTEAYAGFTVQMCLFGVIIGSLDVDI